MHINGSAIVIEAHPASDGHAHKHHEQRPGQAPGRSFRQHPIGKLFPVMNDEEFEFLKDDIAKRGLLEKIILFENKILEGWHRYKACVAVGVKPEFRTLPHGTDALAEVISRNLARRQLLPSQRYGVFLRIAAKYPAVQASLDAIKRDARKRQLNGAPCPNDRTRVSHVLARTVGVSHATIEKMDRLRRLDPDVFEQVVDGDVSLTEALNDVATELRRKQQTALLPKPGFVPHVRLLCGDFRKVLNPAKLPPIQLIIADPPWSQDSLPLWNAVSGLAAKVLRPGGMLIAYPGKMYLPHIIGILGQHLTYAWPFAMLHGKVERKRPEGILSKWQPVLLFSKGRLDLPLSPLDVPGEDCGLAPDVLKQSGAERDRHPWQRPLSEALHWIKHLTRPKTGKRDADWILDPMAGSFGSAKASQLLGRNFIGVDIEAKYVASGRQWLAEET